MVASRRAFTVLFACLLLTACQLAPNNSGLQRYPTLPSTSVANLAAATPSELPPTPLGDLTPTPIVTARPALVLPDETGATLACEANTLRLSFTDDPDMPAIVSRVEAVGSTLYVIVNGILYQAEILGIDTGMPIWVPILSPGDQVAGRPVQELVDLAVDPSGLNLYTLDKVGHVFRWEISTQHPTLSYRASPNAEEPDGLPFNFMSITVDNAGNLVMLDAAHGTLWTPVGLEELTAINETVSLENSSDVTVVGDQIYFLTNHGGIRTVSGRQGSEDWLAPGSADLGLSLRTTNHLGIPLLVMVDGLSREIWGLEPSTGEALIRIKFNMQGMGLLRDGVFANGRLYATADDTLMIYPGPDTGAAGCTEPPSVPPRPDLYGIDVFAGTSSFMYPIEFGTLPPWPRVYPGASRIYRMGVHHGVDIYRYNGPVGFGEGTPVLAMDDGYVQKATLGYDEMTDEQFQALLDRSEALGMTPPDVLDRLEGKQVVIDHGNGILTVYAHLDAIAPGVVTGARITKGQMIGTVGVTGTSAEGKPGTEAPHLHFEVWVGSYYIGYGITARETMWWFEEVFGPVTDD